MQWINRSMNDGTHRITQERASCVLYAKNRLVDVKKIQCGRKMVIHCAQVAIRFTAMTLSSVLRTTAITGLPVIDFPIVKHGGPQLPCMFLLFGTTSMATPYCDNCKRHIGSNACSCDGGPYQFRWTDGTIRQSVEPMFNDRNPIWCVKVMCVLAILLMVLRWLL
jgi:hypothetical protein